MRRLAPAIGFVLLAACAAGSEAGAPQLSQARHALEAAPGKPARATVMVVFATWADGARELLPRLGAFELAHRSEGLQLVGVAIDEDQRFVEPFLRELGVTLQVLADPGGRKTGKLAPLERVPAVLVLDGSGELRWRPEPRGVDLVMAEVERVVADLLAPAPAQPAAPGSASTP